MEIVLLSVGKTDRTHWSDALEDYYKRLQHYIKFSFDIVSPESSSKKTSIPFIKEEEENRLLKKIRPDDHVILLDERGKSYTSETFALSLQKQMNQGNKRIVFVVGGAFGFSTSFLQKFPHHLRLSSMTFSHQMVRLFFCEQLYRAFTILNNHPYHNA